MAEVAEIAVVRLNTGLNDNVDPWTDDFIGDLIDNYGTDGASASIWRSLAASYSTKVDVTEAGASHKFSDLFKNASAMATKYEALVGVAISVATPPRVNSIVRE